MSIEFWSSTLIDPADRQSWKAIGDSGPGHEFVYLLSDEAGALVYVGITWSPFVRWTHHARHRAWWPSIRHATVWRCPDAAARRYESACIHRLNPTANIHQVRRGVR